MLLSNERQKRGGSKWEKTWGRRESCKWRNCNQDILCEKNLFSIKKKNKQPKKPSHARNGLYLVELLDIETPKLHGLFLKVIDYFLQLDDKAL